MSFLTTSTIALGVLSLAALAVAHLALTDIRHGEGNLVQEWQALRLAFAVLLAFNLSALAVISRLARLRGGDRS